MTKEIHVPKIHSTKGQKCRRVLIGHSDSEHTYKPLYLDYFTAASMLGGRTELAENLQGEKLVGVTLDDEVLTFELGDNFKVLDYQVLTNDEAYQPILIEDDLAEELHSIIRKRNERQVKESPDWAEFGASPGGGNDHSAVEG